MSFDTVATITPKIIVISIQDLGLNYLDLLKTIMIPIYEKVNKDLAIEIIRSKIDQVYQESVRQIFDSMTVDIQDFSLNLLSQPYFNRFIDGSLITESKSVEYKITNAYKEFALGIYFIIYNQGIFNTTADVLLASPGVDHLVLRLGN